MKLLRFSHSSILTEAGSPLIGNEHRESNELGKTREISINSVWFFFLLVSWRKTIDIHILSVDVISKQCSQQRTECTVYAVEVFVDCEWKRHRKKLLPRNKRVALVSNS